VHAEEVLEKGRHCATEKTEPKFSASSKPFFKDSTGLLLALPRGIELVRKGRAPSTKMM
jgi:hypothetical protein